MNSVHGKWASRLKLTIVIDFHARLHGRQPAVPSHRKLVIGFRNCGILCDGPRQSSSGQRRMANQREDPLHHFAERGLFGSCFGEPGIPSQDIQGVFSRCPLRDRWCVDFRYHQSWLAKLSGLRDSARVGATNAIIRLSIGQFAILKVIIIRGMKVRQR